MRILQTAVDGKNSRTEVNFFFSRAFVPTEGGSMYDCNTAGLIGSQTEEDLGLSIVQDQFTEEASAYRR